ncbi:MAG: hypothetical protein KGI98_08230 [Euryarchaeota archaeon]|nr:hypothetical protein [Euryarchaeota archaeon]
MSRMLAAGLEPEEERIRLTGLARSTFQEAKRRMYSRGWLRDRYLPALSLVGVPTVSFLLTRAFAERVQETVKRLQEDRETVHLWVAEETIFAVVFHRAVNSAKALGRAVAEGALGSDSFLLSVDPSAPSVPVYFDFEGIVAQWTGSASPARYPRPLPHVAASRTIFAPLTGLDPLLSRPFLASTQGRAEHLLGPAGLPRSQKRLLLSGKVEWRVMPSLSRLPPFHGVQLSHLVLARGRLRPGVRLLDLYRTLAQELQAHPFLLVSDTEHVLVGGVAVSRTEGTAEEAPGEPTATLPDVLATQLEGIELTRLPLRALRSPLFHRYDRLSGPPPR